LPTIHAEADLHAAAQMAEPQVSEDQLRAWVESVASGPVTGWRPIVGGNRCRSWAVDVAGASGMQALYLRYQPPRPPSVEPYTVSREARVYAALDGKGVLMPRPAATHPSLPAMLTERIAGRADFRRAAVEDQAVIALEFIDALATLHATAPDREIGETLTPGSTIAECVRHELAVWRAMYEETDRSDALIDLALEWLEGAVPAVDGTPVLVHGDAGPGNFLFDGGHLTALLDWELAHRGDPIEDLAWFSMRSVMEPVPNFRACLDAYSARTGEPVDRARLLYHRAFVCLRVVIIRHRNVTGRPGSSIVSRALNRRLLVSALAEANHAPLPPEQPLGGEATPRTGLYDGLIETMRRLAAAEDIDVVETAKDAARVLKYLRDVDRWGRAAESADLAGLAALLGREPIGVEDGLAGVLGARHDGAIGLDVVIGFIASQTARAAQLAASASGGLADRTFPPLDRASHD
jgi:aminoglycoside phosphotransferase (APT) family kinase protein